MDNAKFHKTRKIKEFFQQNPNIILIYNATYSPEYNPIEIIFGVTKHYFKYENQINRPYQFTCNIIEKSLRSIKEQVFSNCFENCLRQFISPDRTIS